MAGFSSAAENAVLKLIFNGTPWANVADNAASSPYTTFYCALHTADPTDAGAQNANECSYGAYARVAVSRASGTLSITANVLSNVAAITFPTATSGTQTATHFSVGVASSGATVMLVSGALGSNLAISTNIAPTVNAGQFTITLT